MLRVFPFRAWRPTPEYAAQVASVPYDVVNREEAAALARDNPLSFLRISRSEIELPEETDPYAPEVYRHAAENFQAWRRRGVFVQEDAPCLYLYRLEQGRHAQTGVVACCHVDDYKNDIIKKHEKTRQEKEDDRTHHIMALKAHTGPVLLTYRDDGGIADLMQKAAAQPPLYRFTAVDGVAHTLWRIPDFSGFTRAFARITCAYIADGHHRAASSVRVAEMLRGAGGKDADAEYARFMAILFPADQLRILPYNRLVKDLCGMSARELLAAAARVFDVLENAPATPAKPGEISMYLAGHWYSLRRRAIPRDDPIAALDVSALQNGFLAPVLGISDPRTDQRIDFVGGARGTEALEKAVNSGTAAVAFSMYPVAVDQLMAIADRGVIMPPKSTWFEPKPRSGLLIHVFE